MKKIIVVILLLFTMFAFAEEKGGPVFKKDGSILNPPKVKIRVIAQGDKSINLIDCSDIGGTLKKECSDKENKVASVNGETPGSAADIWTGVVTLKQMDELTKRGVAIDKVSFG